VVNGASFRPATDPNGAVAPGAIVAIFGSNLASGNLGATSTPLPTTLGDTSVIFMAGNIQHAAPLFFVSPGQINAQMPFEILTVSNATVVVRRNTGTSIQRTLAIGLVSPGIFTANQQGTGPGAILHADSFQAVSDSAPARPGETILIYCTGLGPVTPAVPTAQRAPDTPLSHTARQVSVNIANIPAQVSFSGLAPGFVSLYQVNAQVPSTMGSGTQPVQIFVENVASNVATIAVR
ncbi:MAG: hypothetical protein ACREUU_13855, partial [Gammaproteobacteria bacterium]